MILKDYETVIILTPVLSDDQVKETVAKFRQVITDNGGQIVHETNWGLSKLAYSIQKKNTGFYCLIEFKAPGHTVDKLEISLRRDERVLRFLTVALDKHAVVYNQRKRNGEFNKKETAAPVTTA